MPVSASLRPPSEGLAEPTWQCEEEKWGMETATGLVAASPLDWPVAGERV
ncbi:MAG: hypothetical protein U9R72_05365 [Chloroflexota bacterium]|nr:hypothetical protein [Chloroflexota bacterium]